MSSDILNKGRHVLSTWALSGAFPPDRHHIASIWAISEEHWGQMSKLMSIGQSQRLTAAHFVLE
jgi:hypothetical protein